MRRRDLKTMAFLLALKNNVTHPLKNESAGRNWLKGFLKRHPNLSLRTPRATSYARATGFTKENVKSFFDMYEPEFERVKRQPHRIYNVDETGMCIVQHKSEKIITLKGKKEVATITSAERGKLITVVVCMNAMGMYIPPLIIWPRKNMKEELMDGAPAGSIWACHPSGWIQMDIFSMWFDHFIKHTASTADNPVLLVLDGHSSHTRNILLLEKANHVSIICLPPHSSHKMQPLDVGFMRPLRTYYASEIESFLRNVKQEERDRRKDVTTYRIARLFGAAYCRAATMEIAINSFRKTGLYPFNNNIFEDYDFPVSTNDARESTTGCDNIPATNTGNQSNLMLLALLQLSNQIQDQVAFCQQILNFYLTSNLQHQNAREVQLY
ncbi:PREDICTED: jerky protein homolog-like [Vollenhovia emeryi]|uniref:jerky protein homolog-like n=1 Tax=Vollenhovia emeryi TaxID=411798 RepID=UPI0005F490B7|nr:PREDICTED: jerky protein homolog-like [Vollenhovia emeryi]